MAKTTVWRGSRQIHPQPGYPREITTAAGTRNEFLYEGPLTTLKAAKPKIGQTITGYPGAVEQTEVYPKDAGGTGPGVLRVLVNDDKTPGDIITSGGNDIIYEIEWVDLNPKLERAALYMPGGGKTLTDDDLDRIEEWRNADTRAKRATTYATLSANAQHFVDKIRRGQESFVSPAPVVRKTTKSFISPNTTKMGKRVGKPYATAPADYEWLTTADKAIKQGSKGKWERVEEFTGAEEWDHDIYPTG